MSSCYQGLPTNDKGRESLGTSLPLRLTLDVFKTIFALVSLCSTVVYPKSYTMLTSRYLGNREQTTTATRRQRQRERHQTKGLMTRTMAAHVRYNSWYIS